MYEAYAVESTKVAQSEDWKPYLLKILIGILVVFLLAEFSFYVIVVPVTSKIHLSVEGVSNIGYDEIRSLAGLTENDKWIDFNSAETALRLASNPLFYSVVVEKKFPDKVIISVNERMPVAISFGTINGRTVPVEIDSTGVVFRIGSTTPNSSLPLITGLTFENPVPGMRLHASLKPLLEQLSVLENTDPALVASISEIKIETKTYGGFDLVVYPVHTPIRVRTDKALNEDSLQYMMLVLDVVQDLSMNVEEIDIRAGTVAYRVKGEQI